MSNAKSFGWLSISFSRELSIAGNFIYNGLYAVDQIPNFALEDEVFEILYNLSVGLERLAKVAITLLDFQPDGDIPNVHGHLHTNFFKRIESKSSFRLNTQQWQFLEILHRFYNEARYDRYKPLRVHDHGFEKEIFSQFLCEQLNIKQEGAHAQRFPLYNNRRIKRFIGKLVSKFTIPVFDIIKKRADELQIYCWEMGSNTKAFRIFLGGIFRFLRGRHLLERGFTVYSKESGIFTTYSGLNQFGAYRF